MTKCIFEGVFSLESAGNHLTLGLRYALLTALLDTVTIGRHHSPTPTVKNQYFRTYAQVVILQTGVGLATKVSALILRKSICLEEMF